MQELHKNTEDIYAPDQETAARIRQIKRTMLRQLGNWIKPLQHAQPTGLTCIGFIL